MIKRLAGITLIAILSAAPVAAQLIADVVDAFVSLETTDTEVVGKRLTVIATSSPVFTPFTGIVLEIASQASELTGSVRFEESSGWSSWKPLYFVRSAVGGSFMAGLHSEPVRSNIRFQVRVLGPSDGPILIRRAGTFDNRLDDDRSVIEQQEDEQRSDKGAGSGIIVPPTLISRPEWGADLFIRGIPVPLANPSYDYMTFHHAAGFSALTEEEGKAQVKAIQDLHQNIRGWSDIGYQFLIDQGGRLYQGRPFMDTSTSLSEVPVLARGAHVGGHNVGNIGICLLGCYHPPEGSYCREEITVEALDTYVTLFSFLSENYGVSPPRIRGHRDFSSTACPGDNNYVLLPQIRTDVVQLLITGNQALGSATLTASIDEDGVVLVSWEFLEDFGIESYRLERTFEGQTIILHTGLAAESRSFSDSELTRPGIVTYALFVHGAGGRQQRLQTIDLDFKLPDAFVLSEAFPNPAQTMVNLRYYLAHDGFVRISLYDTAGRTVAQTTAEYRSGDQWFVSRIDVSSLASGVYYFRIKIIGFAGVDFDRTRSIVVVR